MATPDDFQDLEHQAAAALERAARAGRSNPYNPREHREGEPADDCPDCGGPRFYSYGYKRRHARPRCFECNPWITPGE